MKVSNFSLIEKKNYNKTFRKDINFYIKEYIVLMNEFITYFEKYIEYKNFKKYHVIYKGIQSITHIFMVLLLYSKNLSLTLYHCKKSFLYYVEFINQIGDEGNSYLQLNSKDAILFIYKKSIFEINNEVREEMEQITKDEEILDDIKKFTSIFEKIYFYVTMNIIIDEKENIKTINNNLIKILDSINKKRTNDENLFDKINSLIDFLIFNKVENTRYFEIIKLLIKKKKFTNLTKNEFEKLLKKKETLLLLKTDTYKGFINIITK
tara:strand:+ start:676 stop:1470 length:795 start_codon:yes stop_codon:yes gene_type:complete